MTQIRIGRNLIGHLELALRHEWLVTNGLGGYASSTIVMANTRRYHGLLVASSLGANGEPPLSRKVLVSKLNVVARLGGDLFPLTTNEYTDGTIDPHGYHNLESFALEGTNPVFTWSVAGALIEQRVWMAYGHNTTFVTYTLTRATCPLALEVVPLCTYRDFHHEAHAEGWALDLRSVRQGVRVTAFAGGPSYWVRANRGTFVAGLERHWEFRHRAETYRGMDDREDLFAVGRLDVRLAEGETLALVLSTERDAGLDWETAYEAEQGRLADLAARSGLEDEPGWVRRLALSADQFLVSRPTEDDPEAKTIVAGYHWLGECSRDSLVSLPGLTLTTRRYDVAAKILRAYARFIDQGMLPDRIADEPSDRVYQSADAVLWYLHALERYWAQTGDLDLIEQLYPDLLACLDWLEKGTRHGLGVDPEDGLLRAGEPGVPMSWMNARVGERAVTLRSGKAVEVNALWYNGLRVMALFAEQLDRPDDEKRWTNWADRVAQSFARFWYEPGGYLYDVIDGPEGEDARLRPNQILAVSLPYAPLTDPKKAKAVMDMVARHLHVSYGLRTLGLRQPGYVGRYGGDQAGRNAAYHQGTVWSWLIGPFVQAHLKVYGDLTQARSFLRPFVDQLTAHGLGNVSEIFDGTPPHAPRGCIADAWGVAAVLCGWQACHALER